MNILAVFKVESLSKTFQINRLSTPANQAHFDPRMRLDKRCVMAESGEIKVSAQLAVNPNQQVFVELCRYSCFVVIGVKKHLTIFHQIETYQQAILHTHSAANLSDETDCVFRLRITDVATEEEEKAGLAAPFR